MIIGGNNASWSWMALIMFLMRCCTLYSLIMTMCPHPKLTFIPSHHKSWVIWLTWVMLSRGEWLNRDPGAIYTPSCINQIYLISSPTCSSYFEVQGICPSFLHQLKLIGTFSKVLKLLWLGPFEEKAGVNNSIKVQGPCPYLVPSIKVTWDLLKSNCQLF